METTRECRWKEVQKYVCQYVLGVRATEKRKDPLCFSPLSLIFFLGEQRTRVRAADCPVCLAEPRCDLRSSLGLARRRRCGFLSGICACVCRVRKKEITMSVFIYLYWRGPTFDCVAHIAVFLPVGWTPSHQSGPIRLDSQQATGADCGADVACLHCQTLNPNKAATSAAAIALSYIRQRKQKMTDKMEYGKL